MASLASIVASMTFGYTIGFGYLTACDAFKLTWECRNPARALFVWMVWGEIFACIAMSAGAMLFLHGVIKPSVLSVFAILILWVFQVHFILQIIINRVSIIARTPKTPNRIKWATVVVITILNMSVFITFIPMTLNISPAWVLGGSIWVKVVKIVIMIVDCCLNFYFISEVRENLTRNGLQKYEKLARFNTGIVIVSVGFDLALFATTFLPGHVLFVAFLPVTYISKLRIELSMTKLIKKIARQKTQPSSGRSFSSTDKSELSLSYPPKGNFSIVSAELSPERVGF